MKTFLWIVFIINGEPIIPNGWEPIQVRSNTIFKTDMEHCNDTRLPRLKDYVKNLGDFKAGCTAVIDETELMKRILE